MERLLLTLAVVAAAGAANAQTATGPASPPNDNSKIAVAPARVVGGEATARKRIERDGYRDVQGLAIGSDGLWQGTAMRGDTSVQVIVDRAGNVIVK
jgi:hypothetical protein